MKEKYPDNYGQNANWIALQERIKDNPLSAYQQAPSGIYDYDFIKFFKNANNLEYEIELRYGHDGLYERNVWQCCNENKFISICQIKVKYDKNWGGFNRRYYADWERLGKKEDELLHWGLYHCGE